ncbi:MAG: DNA polymerase III subunit gamma/tau [Muribaculaceae bacterium]|nr:DNA polymerase III subunit gamma/tau [Muribaculaceae bacterium]
MSESYIVSARKYRPSSFATVVGQKALTHTLKTAIASDRLAHAYLFCGPRGVGKTSCARIFAKTINCQHRTPDGEACNECESCQAFNEQRSYNIVELDAASNNSVDDIRNLTDQVRIPPQIGRYKVFIIDEVHMLSTAAFNAFLKTLEEPPEYAVFILATTEKQKVIPTILSRCQIYDFARITVPDIVAQLQYIGAQEGITAEPAALNVIAQKADGAMRDALSIYDQVAASTQGNITYQSAIDNLNVLDYDYYFRLDETFLSGAVADALLIYKEIRDKGFDSLFFVNGLAQHLRDLMVAATPATASLLEMNREVAQRYVAQAAKFGPRFFYKAMDLCNDCDINYRQTSNKQFLVELTLIKICQILSAEQQPSAGTEPMKPVKSQAAPAAAPSPAQTAVTPSPAPQATPSPSAPAPASMSAPMPTPPPPVVPQAAPAPRRVISAQQPPKRVMISGVAPAAKKAESSAPVQTGQVRREPFTEEQLVAAWNDFIVKNPQDKIIINTMRTSLPMKMDDTTYQVRVESDVQVNFMESQKSKILSFLRTALNNDFLALNVVKVEAAPRAAVMTQHELVKNFAARNQNLQQLISDFKLGLA